MWATLSSNASVEECGAFSATRDSMPLSQGVPVMLTLLAASAFTAMAQTQDLLGTKDQPLQVTQHASIEKARPITLKVGEQCYLALHKNGGTGYFWSPTVENAGVIDVTFLETRSTKPSNQLEVGNPEDDVFVVQGLSPGTSTVQFDLKRAKSEPAQSAFLKFSVTPR
jgi:predicted secreted protein